MFFINYKKEGAMDPIKKERERLAQALRRGRFNPIFMEIAVRNGLAVGIIRNFLDLLERELREESSKQKH